LKPAKSASSDRDDARIRQEILTMRVCLVTTGQPASNPRLVKEADTLADAGYDVHVVAAYSGEWAVDADRDLARSRPWSQTFVDWRLASAPWVFWTSRVRHGAARLTAPWVNAPIAADAAVSRVSSELGRAAMRSLADLYIAHNLGALPAAWRAARRHGAKLGFDAEDFHAGQRARGDRMRAVVERVERRYLPECDYVTASSPGIADAYRASCGIAAPQVVLNVFPRSLRPTAPPPRSLSAPVTLYWFSQTIGPGRGLEDIVRALGRVPAGSAELHLRGHWASGYETTLRRLAGAHGVADELIVAHPMAAPGEMVRRSATYDVGLALEPGDTDNNDLSISNKLFTYLLAGQALIATDTHGQRWLLDQIPGAALSYRPGDVETLASRLHYWIDHRGELTAARRAAWLAGEARFNWDVERETFLDVVRRTFEARDVNRHLAASAITPGPETAGAR
jgi:hypothetical protein